MLLAGAMFAGVGACSPTEGGTDRPGGDSGASMSGSSSGMTGVAPGASGATSAGAGQTTTAAGSSSTPGAAAGASSAGTSGAVTCSNTDLNVLPIDQNGWVARTCNNVDIQGAFYCYDDGLQPSGCTEGVVPYAPGGMCLQGSTIVDPDFYAWGAGIGLSLNETGEVNNMPSVKSPYDAAGSGVLGFNISITGDTAGVPIRVQFTASETPDGPSPFVQVPGAGDYQILIADALIPEGWNACTGDACFVNPNAIYDMQIQIVGGMAAANYNFCVSNISPITDGTTPVQGGGTLTNYGSSLCQNYDIINIGPYAVQNNAYNGASHCIQALWDNANTGGFLLTSVNANAAVGGPPASFPSLVHGWHVDGQFYGGYTSARQLSTISSIPSTFSVTVPASGTNRYNATYDNWIGPSSNPGGPQGTLEHMIWINYRDTTPIGTNQNSPVMLGGAQWDVWYGANNGWNTVSYVRATNAQSVDIDVKQFIQHSIDAGYASGSDYLLGVQAGFEIWESTQNFSVDSFTAGVN